MASCSWRVKQFFLLLWKNFILQFRRPVSTVLELVLPVIFVILIVILKLILDLALKRERCFVTFDSDHLTLPSPFFDSPPFYNGSYNIYYAPDNENVTGIVNKMATKFPMPDSVQLRGFSTQESMVSALQNLSRGLPGCFIGGAGVFFDNLNGSELEYTIRLRHEVGNALTWNTRTNTPPIDLPGPRVTDNFYLSEGFLQLQNLVGQSIVEWRAQLEGLTPPDIDISVRQLPFPPYTQDFAAVLLPVFVPILIIFSFQSSFLLLVKELVSEKELRLREAMLMAGIPHWLLWSSWYFKQFIFYLCPVVLVAILLKVGRIFEQSDIVLILLLMLLFLTSIISLSFLVSVLFNSTRIAMFLCGLLFVVFIVPIFVFSNIGYQRVSTGAKLGSCLISPSCLGVGLTAIFELESNGEGLTWSNAAQPLSPDDSFTIAYVYGMLILDTVGYMVLAWYINGVKPGTYGVPKPFYFPCLPSYWTGKPQESCSRKKTFHLVEEVDSDYDPSAHEEMTDPPEVGISIQKLTKIYGLSIFSRLFSGRKEKDGVRRKAVDNLSLDMYKGQITALLGHNGAGKTTAMSVLTGIFTPTGGTARINGSNILKDMDQIRKNLGFCPQHNILFELLTVKEHLKFFLRLRNERLKSSAEEIEEIETMVRDLHLMDKMDTKVNKLSGGMKRKLSVGIALIGAAEVVILDEPTTGMDPYARRATWDLLIKYKQDRTILLSTHLMDEADLLGDRIAIMAEGKLKCSGSSLFLKSRYGVGYHMTIVKESTCDSSQVESLVKSMVPQAEQVTDVGAELSFILPSNSTAKFPDLFDILEARKVELGLASFGVSITTMEEVFMKVAEGTDETLEASASASTLESNSPFISRRDESEQLLLGKDHASENRVLVELEPMRGDSDLLESPKTQNATTYEYAANTGLVLWFQQFCGMFLKRVYDSFRFYISLLSQFALPLVFILIALIIAKTQSINSENDPKRKIELRNSAILPNNVTLFYAQFGNISLGSSNFNFSDLEPSDLGATNLLNLTDPVQAIIDGVESSPPSQTEDCCQYRYQLLDGFCASRTAGELSTQCDNSDFGYSRCKSCLSCCTATNSSHTLPSCTSTASLIPATTSNINFCPSPPKTSVADSAPSGLLESENVYVAEHLLYVSAKLQPQSFFRHYQAGFTITKRDPPFSVCGCSGSQTEPQVCEFFSPLHPYNFNDTTQCPDYTFNENHCATLWIACLRQNAPANVNLCSALHSIPGCSQLEPPPNTNVSNICYSNESLSSCYSIDGLSADVLKAKACDNTSLVKGCNSQNMDTRPVGATYSRQEPSIAATVWYNNQPYHMPAAALNTFHTIVLRKVLGSDSYKITVNNHPLPRNITGQLAVIIASGGTQSLTYSLLFMIGVAFMLASFVLTPAKEKENKAKHLQFVSGASPLSYWLAISAWDFLTIFVLVIATVILVVAFQVEGLTGEGLGVLFTLLIFTCWAGVPFVYLLSIFFKKAFTAYRRVILLLQLVTMIMFYFTFFLQSIPATYIYGRVYHYGFLLVPTYSFMSGFRLLYQNQLLKNACNNPGVIGVCPANVYQDNPLSISRPGIGLIILFLALEGCLYFFFIILIEYKCFCSCLMKRRLEAAKNKPTTTTGSDQVSPEEDNDVSTERTKVHSGAADDNCVVVINNLVMEYPMKPKKGSKRTFKSLFARKRVLDKISLAIPNGECFGLLGVNGAGKTTTFSILTGEIFMTSGSVSIAGYDVRTSIADVRRKIGYCPQFNALIERLTGRELLTMFARLRGVPEKQIKQVVETEITRVDLKKYANKKCGDYSGGNKRKLSTAIALIGNPPIVLLDEPTTGMDPVTRRYIWDVLTQVTREGRSIILSSHSMEECEALCTRIAIMVNGSFKCLGSIQHLKSKFGSGYTLQTKVKLNPSSEEENESDDSTNERAKKPDSEDGGSDAAVADTYNTRALHTFIKEQFDGATKLEEYQGAVTYQLPSGAVSWSSVFRLLEENKERLGIVDYSVSQTTLEQVFITFAKEQKEEEE